MCELSRIVKVEEARDSAMSSSSMSTTPSRPSRRSRVSWSTVARFASTSATLVLHAMATIRPRSSAALIAPRSMATLQASLALPSSSATFPLTLTSRWSPSSSKITERSTLFVSQPIARPEHQKASAMLSSLPSMKPRLPSKG